MSQWKEIDAESSELYFSIINFYGSWLWFFKILNDKEEYTELVQDHEEINTYVTGDL